MTVYFVEKSDEEFSPIKIGFTDDVGRRLISLGLHYNCNIRLLASVLGGRRLERALHVRFFDDRIGNEWFRRSKALLALIASVNSIGVAAVPRFDEMPSRSRSVRQSALNELASEIVRKLGGDGGNANEQIALASELTGLSQAMVTRVRYKKVAMLPAFIFEQLREAEIYYGRPNFDGMAIDTEVDRLRNANSRVRRLAD